MVNNQCLYIYLYKSNLLRDKNKETYKKHLCERVVYVVW